MPVRGMFNEYLGVPNTQQTNPDTLTGTARNNPADLRTSPRTFVDAAESFLPVTAPTNDTVYEGDNRPIYIKERTNITADQYNQFLSEFDDAVDQSNLNYRQALIRQRIDQEANGTTYSQESQALQNQALQTQLFNQAVSGVAEKYGVPMTYTTKGGDVWRINPNGKYTKTYDAGPDFGDYLKAAVKVAITTVATAGIGSAVAAGLGAAGMSQATANVIADIVVNTAASGGDLKQGIISAFAPGGDLEGVRQVTDYFPDGLEGMADLARTVYDAANSDIQPNVDTDFDITIDKDQEESITVDQDTGDVTVNVPEPTDQVEDTDAGGGGGADTAPGGGGSQTAGGATDSTTTTTTTGKEDKGVFNPELPWIYKGDGVFVHGRTGETRNEDVTDYDPYIIGEGYGTGTDPASTVVGSGEGDTTGEVGLGDLLGNLGTIFDSGVDDDTTITTTSQLPTTTPTTPTTGGVDQVTPTVTDGGGWLPTDGTVDGGDVTDGTVDGNDTTGGTVDGGDATDGTVDGGGDTGGTVDGGGDAGNGGGGTGGGTGDGSGDGNGNGTGSGTSVMGLGSGGMLTQPQPIAYNIPQFQATMIQLAKPVTSRDYLSDLIMRLK